MRRGAHLLSEYTQYVYLVVGFLNAERPDREALGASFRAGLDQLVRGLGPPAKPAARRR